MNDLALDLVNNDLVIENGDLQLLNSEAAVARQTLSINLQFYQGEWFLDLDYGVPYFQTIIRKGVSKILVDSIIRNVILTSYRISTIESFESEIIDKETYVISNFVGTTTDGEIVSLTNQTLT